METSQLNNIALDAAADPATQDVVVNGTANMATTNFANESIFSYFWHAGFLIKTVMLVLLISSIWSWAMIIKKYFTMKKLKADADYFEEEFWSGTPLESLYNDLKDAVFDPMSNIFCSAMAEWERFTGSHRNTEPNASKDLAQRISRTMEIDIANEINDLEKGMVVLSSLGSNGVIVGLFGTVIGILNGFKVISLQQSASLSTVGPVITEALITTAMGIFVSISAAFAYNYLSDAINRYASRLETFADEFTTIITRQFDEQ